MHEAPVLAKVFEAGFEEILLELGPVADVEEDVTRAREGGLFRVEETEVGKAGADGRFKIVSVGGV